MGKPESKKGVKYEFKNLVLIEVKTFVKSISNTIGQINRIAKTIQEKYYWTGSTITQRPYNFENEMKEGIRVESLLIVPLGLLSSEDVDDFFEANIYPLKFEPIEDGESYEDWEKKNIKLLNDGIKSQDEYRANKAK